MTDTGQIRESLGVGSLLSRVFSLYFANVGKATMLALAPAVIGMIATIAILGSEFLIGSQIEPPSAVGLLLSFAIQVVTYSATAALMVSFAYDASLGRPVRFGVYLGSLQRVIAPLVVLSVVVYVATVVGMIALILPGLWVLAVWGVFVPILIIEGASFSSLSRSAKLTKGYRWPIIGLLFLLYLIIFAVSFVISFVTALLVSGFGIVLALFVQALLGAVSFAIANIGVALLYARLREIKEGVAVDSLADVFS